MIRKYPISRLIWSIGLLIPLIAGLFWLGNEKLAISKAINDILYHLSLMLSAEEVESSWLPVLSLVYLRLYVYKWVATGIFSVIYMLLSLLLIHWKFRQKAFTLGILIIYSGLIGIAGISFILGLLFDQYTIGYGVAHRMMDFVQSPVILMICAVIVLLVPSGRD